MIVMKTRHAKLSGVASWARVLPVLYSVYSLAIIFGKPRK